MSTPRKGAKLYFAATAVGQASALARFTLLARLLGPEQLGLAAAIILIGQFFDSISDSGADRFIIQDRDGDDPRVQNLVHLLLAGRGVLVALALIALAGPIAAAYHTPVLTAGVMLLAVSPLILGLVHTDLNRQQRGHDFRTESLAMLAAELTGTAVTIGCALVTHDYKSVIWGLIARSLVTVAVSQLRAQRPYRLGYAPRHARRLALFAAPLMLNGLMLFLGGQGDRVVVGERLGPAELGRYSAISLLAYYPIATLARVVGGLHLPRIAAARNDRTDHRKTTDALAGEVLVEATIMLIGFVIAAPIAVAILFGARFAQAGVVVGLVGVLQLSRFIRVWPTTEALAIGRSGVVLSTNIIRLIAFPAALAAYAMGYGVVGIILGFILGEAAAMAAGLVMVNRYAREPMLRGFDRLALFGVLSLTVMGWELALQSASRTAIAPLVAVSAAVLAAIAWREMNVLQAALRAVRHHLQARPPILAPPDQELGR